MFSLFFYYIIWKKHCHSFEQTWTSFTQGCFALGLVEIGTVFLLNNFCWTIFKVLEKGVLLHLNKIESPLPKDALRHVWLKLSQWVWRGFFISYMNIRYHPLGRRAWPFKYTNLFSIYSSRMLCAKLSQNWPSGSEKEEYNVKSLHTYRQINGRQLIRKAHMSQPKTVEMRIAQVEILCFLRIKSLTGEFTGHPRQN